MLGEAFQSLTAIVLILGLGIILTMFSKRLKISSVLLLLLAGLGLQFLAKKNEIDFAFSNTFVVTMAFLTLVLVVFEGSSKFKMRLVDQLSGLSLKMFLSYALLLVVILSMVTSLVFFGSLNWIYVLLAMIFALAMAGTDPTSMFSILKSSSNRVIEVLEIESILNTPFTVILPLIVIQILTNTSTKISSILFGQISPLILQISAGIGVGVLFGYALPKILKKNYDKIFSPILLIVLALSCYLLTEYIGGSGVLGVATMGLFFGNVYVQKREEIDLFNQTLSLIFVIIVFMLVGFISPLHVTGIFVLKAFLLFVLALILRFISLQWVLPKEKFNFKEKLFMTLLIPKGIAVAVVILSLLVIPLAGYEDAVLTIAQLIVLGMIFSLFIATIVSRFDAFFLKRLHEEASKIKKDAKKLEEKKELIEKELEKKTKVLKKLNGVDGKLKVSGKK